MITLHGAAGVVAEGHACAAHPLPAHGTWLDLEDPSEAETALAETATGLKVPSRAALSEVQNSRRLNRRKDAFYLSTPMISFRDDDLTIRPLGFVLTPERLLTVRFQPLAAFDTVKERQAERDGPASSVETFLALNEELIDCMADTLETMSDELDSLSTRIFTFDTSANGNGRREGAAPKNFAPKRRDLALRRLLRAIGRRGKALAKLRASLLGLGRILPYVAGEAETWLKPEEKARFESLRLDVASLDEFETRLSETVQFLLDATLGLINMEQNNTFRVLTVVSVIGIPPTLMASVYGMNFKHMPELDWAWGYPYGLAVIGLSALVPAIYFKLKGWF
ncbi:magnesium transporter CorA family protein [Methylobacterium sp. SyP6R]|uniref:magnesium transporter CorA family protein n=1 Tax=Methylobacterium sp. SyP6R TaxID=2718876 RepID=UPI001F2F80A0|nr:magnesium transporter CorA family protein [Methylobacterium sp. SyP6R]MCF4127352.1 magnesium transporter CorA family protein [Methylobacterium sp. SyP6R]